MAAAKNISGGWRHRRRFIGGVAAAAVAARGGGGSGHSAGHRHKYQPRCRNAASMARL
jgi:hypothetical protein